MCSLRGTRLASACRLSARGICSVRTETGPLRLQGPYLALQSLYLPDCLIEVSSKFGCELVENTRKLLECFLGPLRVG